MTEQASTAPAGWYAAPGDPDGSSRYWDGANWTESVSPSVAPMSVVSDGAIDLRSAENESPEPSVANRTNGWKRLVGRLIDDGAYAGLAGMLTLLVTMITSSDVAIGVALVGYVLLFVGCEYAFLTRTGSTPGKLLFGMAVVEAGPASRPGPLVSQRAAKRAVSDLLCTSPNGALVVLASLFGPWALQAAALLSTASVAMLFIGPGRTISDRLAGTVVVNADVQLFGTD